VSIQNLVGQSGVPVWELEALNRLHVVRDRCMRDGTDLETCLGTILEAAMFFTAADKGTLQLFDPSTDCLMIRAQRGFSQRFLDFFSYVHNQSDAICNLLTARAARVIVEDVTRSELFESRPAGAAVLLNEGVRALQSTPLINRAGHMLGVVSTHFTRPTRVGARELRFMDVMVRQAADFVERQQAFERERTADG
jgi:GAF domain-containing protein